MNSRSGAFLCFLPPHFPSALPPQGAWYTAGAQQIHANRMITGIPLPSSNFPRPGWPHPQALGGSPRTGHGQWRPVWVQSPTAGSERAAGRAGAAPLPGCGAGGSGANLGGSPTAPATGSAQSRGQARRSLCCRQRARASGRPGSPYLLVDEAVEEADQQALSNKALRQGLGTGL